MISPNSKILTNIAFPCVFFVAAGRQAVEIEDDWLGSHHSGLRAEPKAASSPMAASKNFSLSGQEDSVIFFHEHLE